MKTQIRVQNLDIDLITEDDLKKFLDDCLTKDYLNVVHLLSMEYIFESNENEMIHSVLAQADLLLPGEKAILSHHHADVLEAGEMVVSYKNFSNVMGKTDLKDKKCYFIMRTKNEAKSMYRLIHSVNAETECVGIYTEDGNVTDETLINDINTQVPDIIFLALKSEVQEQWISDHIGKLNAKLCICFGAVLPMIRRENPIIPNGIRILRLTKLYKAVLKIPASHFFRKRIFRRKVENYNNAKSR
ncbi:MAG: WecB/TagA/CpsF family glycosyltransferase [Lachnoclostridium sp.]|jgi:UDP-N-acetyl-D-mannosaminuronic acid transferase (WecB/TagA/CpsF family)|nr:WecB/TagA/CpsF family glycosyltransferase [Lachnoclostridium sp.]